MKTALIFLFLVFALFPTDARLQVCAQSALSDAPMTVTVEWLNANIKDSKVVLFHIGQKAEYDAGHIPGAAYLPLNDISTPHEDGKLMLELPPAELLKATLEKLGVSNDSRIILYFGRDWVSPTTRVYYTLDVFGLGGNTSILDGGMPAWTAGGHALSKVVPARPAGRLSLTRNERLVAGGDWVKSNLSNDRVRIIDARNTEFYDGSRTGNMPRGGHIPGARNLPYNTFTGEDSRFKSDAELRKMFEAAGVKPYDDVVTYCHIGQQGTVAYFAAKKLGYKVALYDGSFDEWSRRSDTRVEDPSGGRKTPSISFVPPSWLVQNSGVRILDVRQNVYDYFAGHAANSVHLADSAVRFPAEGYPTQYPENYLIGQLLSRAGVKTGDPVAIYSDGDGVLGATMVAYLLERVGHSAIFIVDGGWRDIKAGPNTSQSYPEYKPGVFDIRENFGIRAVLNDVTGAVGKTTVKFIDARPPDVFRGETKIWARNGHIPGAINLPWKLLVEENNTHKLKPLGELRAVFAAKGIRETDDIIVYCGTSREASLEYVVLKHLLKFPRVRLYEGSWAEYSNHPSARVETGEGR
ncbi:MAG: sulfurtransferase [Pyrinomonadaceae bacterium]